MQESLNKNIQENIFPHWRNHQSLKGKLPFDSDGYIYISIRMVFNELPSHCNQPVAKKALATITDIIREAKDK